MVWFYGSVSRAFYWCTVVADGCYHATVLCNSSMILVSTKYTMSNLSGDLFKLPDISEAWTTFASFKQRRVESNKKI